MGSALLASQCPLSQLRTLWRPFQGLLWVHLKCTQKFSFCPVGFKQEVAGGWPKLGLLLGGQPALVSALFWTVSFYSYRPGILGTRASTHTQNSDYQAQLPPSFSSQMQMEMNTTPAFKPSGFPFPVFSRTFFPPPSSITVLFFSCSVVSEILSRPGLKNWFMYQIQLQHIFVSEVSLDHRMCLFIHLSMSCLLQSSVIEIRTLWSAKL